MINLDDIGSNRVVGVTVAYVVIAFAVLEGLDILQGALGLPPLLMTIAAIVALAGLPLAPLLAWLSQRREAANRSTAVPLDDSAERVVRDGEAAEPAGAAAADAGGSSSDVRGVRASRAWKVAGAGAAFALLVLVGGWALTSGAGDSGELAVDRVAIMPFGTGGAHPDLAWLEQGAMDLLAAKLAGEFGPRAVDPRSVVPRLEGEGEPSREAALAGARAVGAGQAITGRVVGSPDRFTLSAVLHDVDSGRERTRADVQTQVDSLASAVDQLVIKLLSLDAGEAEHRLASLTSADPAAVRSYLVGQAAYRDGRYEDAVMAHGRALELDSTFAAAGLGLSAASNMTVEPELLSRGADGIRLAEASADRLSAPDRRYLEIRSAALNADTREERRQVLERGVRELPERADLWYMLGDTYAHWGLQMDVDQPFERAVRGFERALELDSLHYVSIQHLAWWSNFTGDTVAQRHYIELQEELVGESGSMILALDRAALDNDTAYFRAFLDDVDGASAQHLRTAHQMLYTPGYPVDASQLEPVVYELIDRAETAASLQDALLQAASFALNAGRPEAADELLDRALTAGAGRVDVLGQRILNALYWDGDMAAAERAADELERRVASDDDLVVRCELAQWQAHQGEDPVEHRAPIDRARTDPGRSSRERLEAELCLALTDAIADARNDAPAAVRSIAVLDSILALGPRASMQDPGNIALARLWGERGEYHRALDVGRRINMDAAPHPYYSSFLYETGRWAEQIGNFDEARDAYMRYLDIRWAPESAMEPRVADVRSRLAALTRER